MKSCLVFLCCFVLFIMVHCDGRTTPPCPLTHPKADFTFNPSNLTGRTAYRRKSSRGNLRSYPCEKHEWTFKSDDNQILISSKKFNPITGDVQLNYELIYNATDENWKWNLTSLTLVFPNLETPVTTTIRINNVHTGFYVKDGKYEIHWNCDASGQIYTAYMSVFDTTISEEDVNSGVEFIKSLGYPSEEIVDVDCSKVAL